MNGIGAGRWPVTLVIYVSYRGFLRANGRRSRVLIRTDEERPHRRWRLEIFTQISRIESNLVNFLLSFIKFVGFIFYGIILSTMYPAWILFTFVAIGVRSEGNWEVKSVPTTVETYQNSTVILPCYSDELGEMPITVRWWREGVQLTNNVDLNSHNGPHRVRMHENGSLEVSRAQPEDTGQYVCQASRPAPWGHVTQVYAIRVKYPPKILHTIPETGELEVNLGEEVDMSCMADGYPVPMMSWKMKDMDLQLLDRSRLRFHAENRSLAGRYTCVASNEIGQSAQAFIELRIKHEPEIETRRGWVHASEGMRTQIDCKVTAWPEAQVEWFFKNKKVAYDSRIVMHTSGDNGEVHSLVIRNVKSQDYGNYLCRASNSHGITEKAIELSALPNPAVIKETRAYGKNAHYFIWEVDTYSSIIEYQFWFRNYPNGEWHKLFVPSGRESMGPVNAKSFNLTGLEDATNYEALVLSRNRYGWSRPSKIVQFSTEGARFTAAQPNENYKVETVFEESATDNNIVILDPMYLDRTTAASTKSRISFVIPFVTLIAFVIFS